MLAALSLACGLAFGGFAQAAPDANMAFIERQIALHPGQSGAYVLDTGAEALLARAWLTDHAQRSIDVQYFIWSVDNIGILASAALLRAADRGVKVRVIVDDLLVDAPDRTLLALAHHPNVEIRIYNPQLSVGVPWYRRIWNALTDFRGINQRMHDKTFVVDGKIAITGGRNMAAEYYDYNHDYNFRDRDVLVLGEAIAAMRASFDRFWGSELSVRVEDLYGGLTEKSVRMTAADVLRIYAELHAYAGSAENFAPGVRSAIADTPSSFARLTRQVAWAQVDFIADRPGKNDNQIMLGGGGASGATLAGLVEAARKRIVIQSPYLVLSDRALELFRQARARGVRIQINTNSMASTDNLPAFSGYRSQREELLKLGLEIYEYKPDAPTQRRVMEQTSALKGKTPRFGLHAKTMVIDSKLTFIGTFNLDPRSENLNTEAGVVIHSEPLAREVERAIEIDMGAENSWNAGRDDPDQHVPWGKRSKVRLMQLLPIKSLL